MLDVYTLQFIFINVNEKLYVCKYRHTHLREAINNYFHIFEIFLFPFYNAFLIPNAFFDKFKVRLLLFETYNCDYFNIKNSNLIILNSSSIKVYLKFEK